MAPTSAVALLAEPAAEAVVAAAVVAAAIADIAATAEIAEAAAIAGPAAGIHSGFGLFGCNTEPTDYFGLEAADTTLAVYSAHLGRPVH